ncbi:hypothetical protein HaLaN_20088 [Haematococcus lacustris]|uniref:Secreted protein n=1 Tax=Haematococcus lacustris TaxID=44745 RepID=A0A699ZWG5_HAELA|nr:hypothetical protein HaLaN_20088 [Haematococcus lacustris]
MPVRGWAADLMRLLLRHSMAYLVARWLLHSWAVQGTSCMKLRSKTSVLAGRGDMALEQVWRCQGNGTLAHVNGVARVKSAQEGRQLPHNLQGLHG